LSAGSLYLLAVVVAAALGGLWSGLGAATLSFLGLNFFFTPPFHTLRVDKVDDVVALLVFLAVAVIVGSLLARALDERARAARSAQETRLLGYLATRLQSGEPFDRVVRDFAEAMLDPLGLARCEIRVETVAGPIDVSAERFGRGEGERQVVPLALTEESLGSLIAVRSAGAAAMGDADRRLLEASARQLAVALERERLDEQVREARLESEANELRAALFSSVTHDLRTPLASIKAGVTSLLDPAASHDADQERELLRTVLEETDRLNRLVGNLLDFARVRAGALVPAKQPVGMDEVVESVLARMGPSLHPLRVRTLVHPSLPDVPMDPVQMDQVLTNLLENSARYSPPGGEITISVRPWHDVVQVRIADEGPGIATEDRDRVFDAFFRKDAGSARGGSGLGLAIAKAIVVAHGGKIRIEGAPGGGTAVVFELPMDTGTTRSVGGGS